MKAFTSTSLYNIGRFREILAVMGWSRTEDPTATDSIQQHVKDSKGHEGILLRVNGIPAFFLMISDRAVTDPDKVYDALLFGWNLDAWLTAVPGSRERLCVYNTSYKPNKSAIVRGEERTVADLNLADVLNLETVQRASGKLLLLSADTWHSQDYKQFLESPTGQRRLTVDNALVKDLQNWQLTLVRNWHEQNPEISLSELESTAQKILDEIIFIRFCEDRGLNSLGKLFDQMTSNKPLDNFQSLVDAYEKLYDTSVFDPMLSERLRPEPSVLQAIIVETYEFYKFDLIDVDLLGRIYEEYLSYRLKEGPSGLYYEIQLEQRKKSGVYYTPSYIVEYIVGRAINIFESTNKRPISSVMDPACGSGIFLTTLLKELMRQNKCGNLSEKRALLEDIIHGIDKDERAVRRASQALYYTLLDGEKNVTGQHLLPKLIGRNLKTKDALADRKHFASKRRFDIIVSNPPYVTINREEFNAKYQTQYTDLTSTQLVVMMLAAAIDNLAEGGVLVFLVPDGVLRTKAYSHLRKYILDNTRIVEISFLNYQAFESAVVQNVILVLQREPSNRVRETNRVEVNYYVTPGVFEHDNNRKPRSIPQSNFYKSNLDYVFNVQLTPEVMALYEKIKSQSKPMSDYFKVTQGIKATSEFLRNVPVNSKSKKFLLGKNIQPYVVDWSGIYIDYDPEKASRVPNIRLRKPQLFESDIKLIVRKIAGNRLLSALDDAQYYVASAAYVVSPKRNKISEDFVYLALAILNSRIAKFYYQIEYPDQKTIFPQVRGKDIERLPFPNLDSIQNKRPVRAIINETKRLLSDIKAGQIGGISVYETGRSLRIEELLSKLYGLTGAELSLIDICLER